MSYIFNIRLLEEKTGISYHRIQREVVQKKSSLNSNEKKQLKDCMKESAKLAIKEID